MLMVVSLVMSIKLKKRQCSSCKIDFFATHLVVHGYDGTVDI